MKPETDLVRTLPFKAEALPDTNGHSLSVQGHGSAEICQCLKLAQVG
jgi:hypothetical protein